MSHLLLRTTRRTDRVQIFIIGALDVRSARDFPRRLGRVLDAASGAVQVAVDLGCCTYVDTAGLLTHARGRSAARGRGGGTVRERHQLVRGRHEHVEVLVVEVPGVVVRVAQVVDGVEEGLARGPERGGQVGELVWPPGVEAEVQVEQVELVRMVEDPVRLQRGWWPPRRLGPVRTNQRVGQSVHDGVTARRLEVPAYTCSDGTVAFIRTRQPRVAWRIVAVGPDHFALINDGRKTAHKVIVDREASGVMIMAGTLGFEPVDIPAGHSVRFVIAAVSRYTGGLADRAEVERAGFTSGVLLPTNSPVAA